MTVYTVTVWQSFTQRHCASGCVHGSRVTATVYTVRQCGIATVAVLQCGSVTVTVYTVTV